MLRTLELQAMISAFREQWQSLPDPRQPNNNLKYSLAESALSAL